MIMQLVNGEQFSNITSLFLLTAYLVASLAASSLVPSDHVIVILPFTSIHVPL